MEKSSFITDNRKTSRESKALNIRILKAAEEDAVRIHALMEQVHQKMQDPNLFVCDDLSYVKRHIEAEGWILLATNEKEELLGSLMVRIPGAAEDNLGRELSLPEKELYKVAHMESAVVAEKARGQGILQKLMQQAERDCEERKLEYLLGTVSPKNPASYRTFEKLGYQHALTKEKYGGRLRRIYLKKLTEIYL